MNKMFFFIILNLVFFPSFAGSVYTPKQLNEMVDNRNYPKQINQTEEITKMSFSVCRKKVKLTLSAIKDFYPVKVNLDESFVYSAKAWTNTGAVLLSCYKGPDRMVTTESEYE
jgi:hypothetical protein